MEGGLDAGARKNDVLRHAGNGGHAGMVQLLLALPVERGMDAADRVATTDALRVATGQGHTAVVCLLLGPAPHSGVDAAAISNCTVRLAAEAMWNDAQENSWPQP